MVFIIKYFGLWLLKTLYWLTTKHYVPYQKGEDSTNNILSTSVPKLSFHVQYSAVITTLCWKRVSKPHHLICGSFLVLGLSGRQFQLLFSSKTLLFHFISDQFDLSTEAAENATRDLIKKVRYLVWKIVGKQIMNTALVVIFCKTLNYLLGKYDVLLSVNILW